MPYNFLLRSINTFRFKQALPVCIFAIVITGVSIHCTAKPANAREQTAADTESQQITSFEQLYHYVEPPKYLIGRFQQTRFLAGFDASIHSSGRFRYEQQQAIHWTIEQPIASELVLTKSRILQKQDEQTSFELDNTKTPGLKVLTKIMFSLLGSDWEQLRTFFSISGKVTNGQWQASLEPAKAPFTQFLETVEIHGDTLLRRIKINEKSGDWTMIKLIEQHRDPR